MSLSDKNICKNKGIHHFNIIEGGSEEDVQKICQSQLNFKPKANSNYFFEKYSDFKIEDARKLIQAQNFKLKKGSMAVFIIDCKTINPPAQNALLKIFEEVVLGNYFFLIIPENQKLLPTFLSRAEIFKGISKTKALKELNYLALKKSSIKERIAVVEKILNDIKLQNVNKSDVSFSIQKLMDDFYLSILKGDINTLSQLEAIRSVTSHIDDNGASLKSILEFVVLAI